MSLSYRTQVLNQLLSCKWIPLASKIMYKYTCVYEGAGAHSRKKETEKHEASMHTLTRVSYRGWGALGFLTPSPSSPPQTL